MLAARNRRQLVLEVCVARFRRQCWETLAELRELSREQLAAIFDRWWRIAALNALWRGPAPFRYPRLRNMQ